MSEIRMSPADEVLDEIEKIESSWENTTTSVGVLWRELKTMKFTDTEQILFGIRRGNVGMLIAETEIGKTTLSLNLCLTLAANKTFSPFVNGQNGGRRIMYIDGEATQAELRADIERMISDWSEEEGKLIDNNLLILCDEEIDDELLTLSNSKHMAIVINKALEHKPDLIVVDTMSALFSLHDENSNAEIKRAIMQPLKMLAKEANAGLLLAHHSGKWRSEEGGMKSHAYLGRGGSNLGCLARSVITLIAPDRSNKERVILSVPKAKGYRLADVAMNYDYETRWFKVTSETTQSDVRCMDEVIDFVAEQKGAKTADVIEAFDGKYSRRTVEDALTEAVSKKKITRARHGWYEPLQTALPHAPIVKCRTAERAEIRESAAYSVEVEVDESTILANRTM